MIRNGAPRPPAGRWRRRADQQRGARHGSTRPPAGRSSAGEDVSGHGSAGARTSVGRRECSPDGPATPAAARARRAPRGRDAGSRRRRSRWPARPRPPRVTAGDRGAWARSRGRARRPTRPAYSQARIRSARRSRPRRSTATTPARAGRHAVVAAHGAREPARDEHGAVAKTCEQRMGAEAGETEAGGSGSGRSATPGGWGSSPSAEGSRVASCVASSRPPARSQPARRGSGSAHSPEPEHVDVRRAPGPRDGRRRDAARGERGEPFSTASSCLLPARGPPADSLPPVAAWPRLLRPLRASGARATAGAAPSSPGGCRAYPP